MPARKKRVTAKTAATKARVTRGVARGVPHYTLAQIVEQFGGAVLGDARVRICRVATLESARSGDISFVANPRYLSQFATSQASAVIVGADVGAGGRDVAALPRIVSDNPYAYFAKVSTLLNPMPAVKAGIHRTAVVERTAQIAKSASIAAHATIGARVKIGAHAVIGAGCVIGDDVEIGAETRLYPRVTIYHRCVIGARVLIHAGVVIGADGFGIANEHGKWIHIPQIGRVVIGDDVEIGANTTIDRGALDDTVIEEGVKLDNQIQIGHNVRIGAHTAIAACTGIAGSARIGKHCIIGGAAQISGHITLADRVNISGGTPVIKSLEQPGIYTGVFPTTDHAHWVKNAAQLRHLDKLIERVKNIEHALKGESEKK